MYKNYTVTPLAFTSCVLLFFTISQGRIDMKLPQRISCDNGANLAKRTQTSFDIDRETAISIAKNQATKSYGSLEKFGITACEQESFWRVIFDRKDAQYGKKDPEYLITKKGLIIAVEVVPHRIQNIIRQEKVALSQRPREIDKAQAMAIAERDAVEAYGSLEPFNVVVCELASAWRIIYDLKKNLYGGGPDYVIDKKTGGIIYKRYYQ